MAVQRIVPIATTSYNVTVALRSSTTGQLVTGKVFGDVVFSYWRDGAAAGATGTCITTTKGTWASAGWVETDYAGLYQFGVPNACLLTGATGCKIKLVVADCIDTVIDLQLASTTRGLAGTALPDAAADAAGGLPISDAGGLDVDSIKTRVDLALPAIAAGAAGGLFIAGTNAATTITSALGSALTLSSTGANGHGLTCSGNGMGHGLSATGGATGHGFYGVGGATTGTGMFLTATTLGEGLEAVGKGTSGTGIYALGSSGGSGIYATSTPTGDGITAVGVGAGKYGINAGSIYALTNAIAWNSAWDAEVESEASDALIARSVVLNSTTIATLASQTSFTLTAGSVDNDAYNGCLCLVRDSATATQKCVGFISDYVGGTKTVTLAVDPAVFTMAIGDYVDIVPCSAKAVWDEVITSAVHNVDTSAGYYLRRLYQTMVTRVAQCAKVGTTTTICLDAAASQVADYYKGQVIAIFAGTGAGQARACIGYAITAGDEIATISPAWATAPDATSWFAILNVGSTVVGAIDNIDFSATMKTSITTLVTAVLAAISNISITVEDREITVT